MMIRFQTTGATAGMVKWLYELSMPMRTPGDAEYHHGGEHDAHHVDGERRYVRVVVAGPGSHQLGHLGSEEHAQIDR